MEPPGVPTWEDTALSGENKRRREGFGHERTMRKNNDVRSAGQATKHSGDMALAEAPCNLWEATNCNLNHGFASFQRSRLCINGRHLRAAELPEALARGNWHPPSLRRENRLKLLLLRTGPKCSTGLVGTLANNDMKVQAILAGRRLCWCPSEK